MPIFRVIDGLELRNKNVEECAKNAVKRIRQELENLFCDIYDTHIDDTENRLDIDVEINYCLELIRENKQLIETYKENSCFANKLEQKVTDLVREKEDIEQILSLYYYFC